MLIGENYKIEGDEIQVMLYKKWRNTRTKQMEWRTSNYFSSVKNALKFLVDLEVNKTGLTDLETIVKKQDELMLLIENLPLNKG